MHTVSLGGPDAADSLSVAMSLDAFIAGPNGEYDWIIKDPDIDFREIFSRFDTLLIGRHTFELMIAPARARCRECG